MAGKKGYCFPLMNDNEISDCLNELIQEVSVTPQDMKECRGPVIVNIYKQFLQELGISLSAECLQNPPPFSNLMDPANLHFHEHIQVQAPLYHKLKRLFPKLGVDDFVLLDLINPVPKKSKVQISALINYARFCDQHEDQFHTLIKEKDDLYDKCRSQKDTLAQKKQELNNLAASLAELTLQQHQEFEVKLKEQVALQSQEKNDILQEKQTAKNAVLQLDEKLVNEERTLDRLVQEEKRLSCKLVQSPRRVKDERLKLEERVSELQQSQVRKSQIIAQRNKEITDLKEHMTAAEQLVNSHKELVQNIVRNSEEKEVFAHLEASVKMREEELRDATHRAQRLQEELQTVCEKHAAAGPRYEQSMKDLKETFDRQLRLKEDIKAKMNQNTKVNDQFDKTITELQQAIESERHRFNKMTQRNRDIYHNMLEEFIQGHSTFNDALDKFNDKLKSKPDILSEALKMMKDELAQLDINTSVQHNEISSTADMEDAEPAE